MCKSGDASGLISIRVDRISRSVVDFAGLVVKAQRDGWNLVVLDLGVDLSTPMGEALANMAITFARLESRLVSDRTKDAMAVAKKKGIHCGRPRILQAKVVDNIKRQRAQGKTLQAIAASLNDKGIQTAHKGSQWYASTVRAVLRSAGL
jgi:DNA invertase Pin-like site-specific DNA recombinase